MGQALPNPSEATRPDLEDQLAVRALLGNRAWRLNNLYTIRDKLGLSIRFALNPVQDDLENNLHTRNLVLKSRQHGITTWACIRALDRALFADNQACGLVFHKKEEAAKAFKSKIMYAYDMLPGWLRAELPIKTRDLTGKVEFANGSTIEVSTSHRGGTLQMLHVSEYGPMVSMFPSRAEEVASGALNTVTADDNTIITIESTAMGAWGDYYDRCQTAMTLGRQVEAGTATLTTMDYKLHFYGWWEDPANRIDPTGVSFSDKDLAYFSFLERKYEIQIFPGQRAWYIKKKAEQKDKMKREHPSEPKEAFEGSVEGAYYAVEMAEIEASGRILHLPFIKGLPVHTCWDIGRNDATAIWFFQQVGPWLHFIGYFEANHQGAAYYAAEIKRRRDEFKYTYGTHYLPHDAEVSDWSQGDNRTRKQVVEDMGIGNVQTVDRIENLGDGIEMTRQMLAYCKFDATACGENPVGSGRGGLQSLRAYRKEFDEKSQTWGNQPIKSWANHGADAIRQCAQGFHKKTEKPKDERADARKRTKNRRRSAYAA